MNRKARVLIALLVFLVAAGVYLALPSSRYNLDGLRAFPGLIQVKVELELNTKTRRHEEESGGTEAESRLTTRDTKTTRNGFTTKAQRHEGESGTTEALVSYTPKDWRVGYRAPYYSRANVQMHFLFPLYWAADYRIARALGFIGQARGPAPTETRGSAPTDGGVGQTSTAAPAGTGVRGLQLANAICAALAVGLFALLVGLLFRNPWTVLATGFGLAFSTAFSSMATNIAEVVPALPWLVLALVLLAAEPQGTAPGREIHGTVPGFAERNRDSPGRLVWAGILLGISAAFYFASAVVGLVLAVGLALRRPPTANRKPQTAALLVGIMAVTVGAIYICVLLLAGYHTLPQLGRALFAMSAQGNYGGLKPSNLVSVWLGLAGSILPVLPENFGGLRNLLGQTRGSAPTILAVVLVLVILLVCAFAVAVFRALRRPPAADRKPQTAMLMGLALFIAALAVSLVWDPYHPKFWAYSNVGLWLMIAGYLAQESRTVPTRQTSRTFGRPALIALAVLCVVATNVARRKADAGVNPKWQAARTIAGIVNAEPGNVVLGGWEEEFDYLTLLVPETNQVSLPDRILEQGSDSTRFAGYMGGTLATAQDKAGSVFFLNLFNQTPDELNAFYTRRLRFPEFIAWLESLRPQAQEVWADPGTGVALYRLTEK